MHPTRHLPVFFAVLISSALGACANAPPTSIPADTTAAGSASVRAATRVAIPNDTGMLAQNLVRSLGQRGWQTSRYDSRALAKNHDYQQLAKRARYRLTVSGKRIGDCRGGDPSFVYNIALIENLSGDVPLALAGASCLEKVIRDFGAGLDRKRLVVPAAVTD